MRRKESKQNAYFKAKRFLGKARDFYVKSMINFDGKVGYGNMMACPPQPLPKNFSATLMKAKNDQTNFKEIHRTIARMNIGTEASWNDEKDCQAGMYRSYSVGLGRIGTIVEDEPCDFRDEEIIMKSEILLPRSYR